MNEIYLEVEIVGSHATIIDWTHWMLHHKSRGNWREIDQAKHSFVRIDGKTTTYFVTGLGNDKKRCQDFAIWYHITKQSGSISTYRLD